ncbi:MAG: protein kinase domain-containing protein [Planctomycetota bacterium]
MSTDITEPQGGPQRRRSREMSLQRGHPPTHVPGYEPERFLGVGAYGEVWVAVERNTGRRVAIKFYAHRGGLDWSLLSREVEKLAFLFADRYVVQLLGVGWDAEPPYYIMEYIEHGSLADRLQQGPMPSDEAVTLFKEVAVGLVHAHGKGVLHCDLKPANILLDQDRRPRLADFGQSRLSHEQVPALGTLFFMAPEQADLEAIPDARWDVYALGAVLYCMLTGSPPYRTGECISELEKSGSLSERLERYRRFIQESPAPTAHRKVAGVDRSLAEIVDRCLAVDPARRYANVQAVLDALELRAARQARWPLMILGAVGPAVLLAVVAWFALQGFGHALTGSDEALTDRALKSNQFAAQYVARTLSDELERRYEMVERVADSPELVRLLKSALDDPSFNGLAEKLTDPALRESESERLRAEFLENPARRALQKLFTELIPPSARPAEDEETSSWFLCDPRGVSTARLPQQTTIGRNYAWRSYFHGGPRDLAEVWRPRSGEHLRGTMLSAVFRSQANAKWIVAVAAPVFDARPGREFLGVVAVTSEVGRFVELRHGDQQFAVLVDWRDGEHKGVILQHPLYDRLLEEEGRVPDRFQDVRLTSELLPDNEHPPRQRSYRDPLAKEASGRSYDRQWLARMEPVQARGRDTGWIVIVQEAYDSAIGGTMRQLTADLRWFGMLGLASVLLLMVGLWLLAARMRPKL